MRPYETLRQKYQEIKPLGPINSVSSGESALKIQQEQINQYDIFNQVLSK